MKQTKIGDFNMTKRLKVYLAGGWFSSHQEKALTFLEDYISINNNLEVFSPRRESTLNGNESIDVQNKVFENNCKAIKNADLIIASTVEKDMGTIWECGFAHALGKPVIYTLFDERLANVKFNLMLAASGIAAFTDKQEFIQFTNELTKTNLKDAKQRYNGEFE